MNSMMYRELWFKTLMMFFKEGNKFQVFLQATRGSGQATIFISVGIKKCKVWVCIIFSLFSLSCQLLFSRQNQAVCGKLYRKMYILSNRKMISTFGPNITQIYAFHKIIHKSTVLSISEIKFHEFNSFFLPCTIFLMV